MGDKKDIGKAFKDKLEELQVSPQGLVWDKIVTDLDEKENNKRIIPIWFKAVSIVVIFLAVGGLFLLSKNNKNNNDVVNVNEHNTDNKLDNIKNKNIENSINNNTPIVTTEIDKLSTEKENKTKLSIINNSNKNGFKANYTAYKNNKKTQISKKKINKITNQQYKNTFANNSVLKNRNLSNSINNAYFKKNKSLLKFTFAKLPKIDKKENLIKATVVKVDVKNVWDISIEGSPIYNKSLLNDYSLDPIFTQNSLQDELATSYGLKMSIPIFENIKIRTGLSYLTFNTNTKNVNYNSLSFTSNILFNDGVEETLDLYNTYSDTNKIDLKHKINYFEIPVEFSINLIKRKIELNTITGISALILDKNHISINNNVIGSANNINNLSYTGNLGFNSKYKINKNLNFSIEPMFKVRFKSYKNINNLSYYLGVYSGIVYSF